MTLSDFVDKADELGLDDTDNVEIYDSNDREVEIDYIVRYSDGRSIMKLRPVHPAEDDIPF